MRANPITPTIDFDRDGIQHGFLRLPYSRNDSAWGAVMIPITQFKSGEGSTALLTGGNHGDEYEGPTALLNFAARDRIDDIRGRIIIVPAMNYPAFQAGTRVSPIDSLNLNRIFPGRPNGSVTEVIADYFSHTLVPMADYVLDIHSGGKTLDFLPFAASHILDDKDQQQRCEAAASAFGAPYRLQMLEIDATGLYDTQVEAYGKVFVTTELGGGGTTSPESIRIAKRGVNNFLIHAGILDGTLQEPERDTICLDMPDFRCYLFCEHSGLVEPCVALGDPVREGEPMARIHSIERTAVPAAEYLAPRDGVVIARHVPSRVQIGDCLFVIGEIM
ncbi:N-alpha-acetyl diaminobutyric acid deacetylase DoeB [Marinobacterium zhoushanense]|uniref:N-alpha-acetyl diaminobutyric acid deacetylase DoeB n=1 Tax=Marinobacterium zhoushanense TaxID=1679163 RepID=A0ABQ1KVN9_9GAMM|nr:N(2)-acetyl-L-2,4-diaminobutanoate deacetylase DoeB [Marinobacterium zhoushanense]GGC09191.1 N-alpha-acetyl diaminobutyric acid deacetylase DoeB [Marinobacterium zhoushanense]